MSILSPISPQYNRSNFKGPYGLMFHHFHGPGYPPDKQGSLSGKDFEKLLLKIGIKNILDPKTWLRLLSKNLLKNEDRCLTFDDGLRCQYDIALPILNKYGLKAFWFVYSAPFEGKSSYLEQFRRFRTHYHKNINEYYNKFFSKVAKYKKNTHYSKSFLEFKKNLQKKYPFYSKNDIKYRFIRDYLLSPEEYAKIVLCLIKMRGISIKKLQKKLWLNEKHLKKLKKSGHIIGLHSYNHPTNLAALPFNEQKTQYAKNLKHLSRVCGRISTVAHPCGSYTKETLKILKSLNIKYGFVSTIKEKNEKILKKLFLECNRLDCALLAH